MDLVEAALRRSFSFQLQLAPLAALFCLQYVEANSAKALTSLIDNAVWLAGCLSPA